ncbi:MAG: type II toxin-antitoxin system Phd/YefM family antitoxin [Phycisphaerales bacterium]|nr:type II toxin-antitoxin system Phd/YefM family antitoxin [Phycisphaerales bacterium]
MIHPEDISSLTDFQRNTKKHLDDLKKSRRVRILTVNGRAAVAIMDPREYESMATKVRKLEDIEAIEQGIRELEAGKGRPAEEVFKQLRAKYGRAGRRRSA